MFVEFLKSLVIPARMKKYRYMSVLISIAIFVLTVYLLIIPFRVTMNNSKDKIINDNILGVQGFYNLESEDVDTFNELKKGNYKIENNELSTSIKDGQEYQHFVFSYVNDDKRESIVHFIFDPFEVRDKQLLDVLNEYNDIYDMDDKSSKAEKQKASEIAMITYVEQVKNPELELETKFEDLRGLDNEALTKQANELTFFDYYNIEYESEKDSYLVAFNKKNLDYQIPLYHEGEKLSPSETRANIIYSEEFDFNVDNFETVNDLGQNIVTNIIDIYVVSVTSQHTLQVIIYVLLYPALIILILWLFFKKNGSLKTYKEYYNIAAICSIIPSILTFILSWFWAEAVSTYGMLLAVYYIFVVYRVNSIPNQV